MEWTEVTEGNPPLNGPIERGFGPFVITDGSTQRVAVLAGFDDSPLSLWSSEDGIEWVNTAISLPVEPAWLEPTPTGYWLMGEIPAGLWYSPDLDSSWEAINLDGLAPEAPIPLTLEGAWIRSVAAVGDTTLIAAQYTLAFDWDQLLGIEPGTYEEYDYAYDGDEESPVEVDPDELSPIVTLSGRNWFEMVDGSGNRISEEWIEEPLLRFIPSTSADGLTLTDADSGETLFEFPNHDAFDWEDIVGAEAFPRFQAELSTLFVLTPDGVEETGPWAAGLGSSSNPQRISLLALNDSVIVEAWAGEEREGYRTLDGTTFVPIPPLPQGLLNIKHDPASGYLYTSWVDGVWTGGDDLEHWISTDAVNWTTLDTPVDFEDWFNQQSLLLRFDGGWLIMKREGGSGITEAHVSLDGEEWQAIDPPPSTDGSLVDLVWENRLLIFGEDSNWLGTLDFGGG